MPQLEHIEAIENRLWRAADNLRANSTYASNEYFLPVMGLVFLRYAYSRYLSVKDDIEADLPTRGGKKRALTKEDFSQKNATTIRLARMNLAVHGLEGDIRQAITYYEDPHELLGKADYVMANPPFNVDEIDADKVKTDPRLPFGLPGVNQNNKVSNGNYVWISYFYGYLNETGRAGFVMSSQASSAGGSEAEVRRKLVETGDVEAMIAIRSNFFYTRTVPCELWFLNRARPETHRDKVLMIDARNIYRQVTRKIYDFSPEHEKNILAIVHLYRGETGRFLALVSNYLQRILEESHACFEINDGETIHPLPDFLNALTQLHDLIAPSLKTLPKNGQQAETLAEYDKARTAFTDSIEQFLTAITETAQNTSTDLNKQVAELAPLIEISRNLSERIDSLYKLAIRVTDICEKAGTTNNRSDITRARLSAIAQAGRTADETRQVAIEQLKQVNYFYQQARYLTECFPEAKLCDVEGLVKLVDRAEIEANDWSLTPGRYVGVAPEEEDENFDFAEALREIHDEIEELNVEAVSLAATIKRNFEALI